jgi:hypothetical protein
MFVNIALSIVSILFFLFWYLIQEETKYLYDSSFLHAYGYLIFGLLYIFIAILSFVINKEKLKILLIITYFSSFIPFLILYTFLPIPGESTTSDISNYKIFDVQVQNHVYAFFPDDIDNYEVIKYDYYYSYPYHHVYNVFLEIRVESNFIEFVESLKIDDYIERSFKYDNDFIEILFAEDLEYSNESKKLYRGDIQKILYSTSQQIVIFEYFQSWSYCEVDDVYYFERFNIDIEEYISFLE